MRLFTTLSKVSSDPRYRERLPDPSGMGGDQMGGDQRKEASFATLFGGQILGEHPLRFWLLQAAIILLYGSRLTIDVLAGVGGVPTTPELTTVGLFLIPILYAALNMGLAGALATAVTVLGLTIPRIVFYVSRGSYLSSWVEIVQVLLLFVIALVVGQRVGAERKARLEAQEEREAHFAAEERYRNLFETNQSPILIVDTSGIVQEWNLAAKKLFSLDTGSLAEASLSELLGKEFSSIEFIEAPLSLSEAPLSPLSAPSISPDTPSERSETTSLEIRGSLYRPAVSAIADQNGRNLIQIVFQDVTEETFRHREAEAYAGAVLRGQEEERRRISHELHDGPVQQLLFLCRKADALSEIDGVVDKDVEGEDETLSLEGDSIRPSWREGLAQLRDIAEEVVVELRRVSQGLRPSILDDLGLLTSLKRLLNDFHERTGIAYSMKVTGDEVRLEEEMELALYRIAQEALTNVDKHARASHVVVELCFGERIELKITDDGKGFQVPTSLIGEKTLGLAGMAERARLVGGEFLIASTPEQGTRVEVYLPGKR